MPEGAFFEQKRASPASLAVVIALHAAAITALALSKTEIVKNFTEPTRVELIPEKKDPPPEPERPAPDKPLPRQDVTYVTPIVQPPIQRPVDVEIVERPLQEIALVVPPALPTRIDPPAQPKVEPREPVRIAATMTSGSERQPPYPAAEQRAGAEGMVTVRILIGADGRVKSVQRVKAASEAFFRATERQALRHWRFKPAMVDGKPVESSQTVTVHFQMMG
jgi:protein TonB